MRFRVEHKLVQVDLFAVIAEQQVKVFKRLAEPEGLHHVLGTRVQRTLHVANRRIAVRDFCVQFKGLENRPAHILVRLVSSECVEVIQAFDELRPEKIVSVVGFHVNVSRAFAF